MSPRTRRTPGVGSPGSAQAISCSSQQADSTAPAAHDLRLRLACVALFVDIVASARPAITDDELDELRDLLEARLFARWSA